jgi:hypothetical protein
MLLTKALASPNYGAAAFFFYGDVQEEVPNNLQKEKKFLTVICRSA